MYYYARATIEPQAAAAKAYEPQGRLIDTANTVYNDRRYEGAVVGTEGRV